MIALLAASSPYDTIFGLPVHTLVVHAVVVLLPLTALAAIVMALRADWSRRLGLVTTVAALVCTGASYVAGKSGQVLQSRIDTPLAKTIHAEIATHASVGRQVKYVALALLVVVALLWWVDRRSRDGGRRTLLAIVLAVVTAVVAVGAIVWTVRAGDSGARAVWSPIVKNTKPGSFPSTH